jgi:hypothetical protein
MLQIEEGGKSGSKVGNGVSQESRGGEGSSEIVVVVVVVVVVVNRGLA